MILYQEQKKILCHKVILASQSTYFSTLLEDNISKYNVTDIDYLEKIIPFLFNSHLINCLLRKVNIKKSEAISKLLCGLQYMFSVFELSVTWPM